MTATVLFRNSKGKYLAFSDFSLQRDYSGPSLRLDGSLQEYIEDVVAVRISEFDIERDAEVHRLLRRADEGAVRELSDLDQQVRGLLDQIDILRAKRNDVAERAWAAASRLSATEIHAARIKDPQ